jgi:alkanesulfonate monooxygenase SsuD/methylene tetrahydromethanopterin reductase-like flavin-dependent oxidoreductase (luciferase family)
MAVTIDSISHGRFGINIISGWQRREYTQMGIWPGAEHYRRRYDYCAEYVAIMRESLETPSGEQASAILPDSLFFEAPVRPGESATFVWSERDIHYLQAG